MLKQTSHLWASAVIFLSLPILLNSQNVTASFATWKDNKKAAYTIIHDDFASYTPSIYNDADPIATARGIKICFGAITSACGTAEWAKARTMISHGHECVNHSHNHKCGGPASECTGVSTYGSADYSVELGRSTTLIQNNTGVRPLFFAHPYDTYKTDVLNYLKNTLGYIGSRAGTPGNINTSNFSNFMQVDYSSYNGTPAALESLRSTLDAAIAMGGYTIREFHGIEDASFAPISRANYTAHLDYVKSKIDDGSVWSATASEAITYKMQRDAFTINTVYTASTGTINVKFTKIANISTSKLKTPVTVNVDLGTIAGEFTVKQGMTNIPAIRIGNIVSFNVYPHQGNIVLKTTTIPQVSNILDFTAVPQSTSFDLFWTNPSSNFDEVMIVAKENTAITAQPSGTSYVANPNFNGNGTAFGGGKVVYRGKGTVATITGLTSGKLYHFKAFSRFGTLWSSGVSLSATTVAIQRVTAGFATWLNNKKAAYTIIHDDFASYTPSIYNIADPIATARGIKICFGAITSGCGAAEWTKARTMMAHGHECVNHSHNHRCGGPASECTGVSTYGTADFPTELGLSTTLIQNNTGVRPLFFIHPYDAHTPDVLNYLQNTLGYIGARSGTPGNINTSNFSDFMRVDFSSYNGTPASLESMRSTLDAAIAMGGYTIREFHGIDDASFGPITSENYTAHLDYVKSKIDDGSLWSATASEAITYKMQRDAYTISTIYNPTAGIINVNFTNITPLSIEKLKTPVTVNVDLGTIGGTFTVTQGTAMTLVTLGSTTIPATRNGNIISFNVYPHQGNVVLRLSAGTQELTSGIQESTTAAALADSLTHFNEAPLADTDLQSQSKDTPTDMYVLSPNPAKDRVDIDLSSSQGKPVELTLTTFFGKVMHHEKIGSVGTARHTLYLNDIGKGQYFLRIQTPGQKPVMKKLIVIQ